MLEPGAQAAVTMTVAHTFATDGGAAQLQCRDDGNDATLTDTKITAIGVNNLTNNPG
ncbi:MAG: hypothetical protein ACE5GC_00515 [Acidimicrobiia bacterium]